MSNYASGFSLEPRLCVKTETILYTHHYTHTSMAGEIVICQKSKPYLPNFSSEFRPVYAGGGGGGGGSRGFEQTPLLVDQWLFARTRKHTKKLIETSLHHKFCSTMGNEVFLHGTIDYTYTLGKSL